MIVLNATNEKIIVSTDATATTDESDVFCSFRTRTSTTFEAKNNFNTTNGTTAVDVCPVPGSSEQNLIDYISIFNRDTVSHTYTIQWTDGSNFSYIHKVTLAAGGKTEFIEGVGWKDSQPASYGYCINVQALTSSPTDAQTVYFGTLPKAPVTAAATSKVYIRKAGTLKVAEIYCYSGTAGTAENWSLYVRVNNTTDYLIQTVGVSASERVFSNTGLSITLNVGDYIEIKGVQPTWATNPATTIYGGYIYIE